jgi:hypothetical protein
LPALVWTSISNVRLPSSWDDKVCATMPSLLVKMRVSFFAYTGFEPSTNLCFQVTRISDISPHAQPSSFIINSNIFPKGYQGQM